jgi:hypothetical protein
VFHEVVSDRIQLVVTRFSCGVEISSILGIAKTLRHSAWKLPPSETEALSQVLCSDGVLTLTFVGEVLVEESSRGGGLDVTAWPLFLKE